MKLQAYDNHLKECNGIRAQRQAPSENQKSSKSSTSKLNTTELYISELDL